MYVTEIVFVFLEGVVHMWHNNEEQGSAVFKNSMSSNNRVLTLGVQRISVYG